MADNNYLDSLVDSGQFTREEVDKAWAQAKQQANANKKKNPGIVMTYAYTTSLFNAILGVGKQPERASVQLNAATRLKAMRVEAALDGTDILKKNGLGEFLNRSTLRKLPIVDSALGGIFMSTTPKSKNACRLSYNTDSAPSDSEWAAFKSKLAKILAVYDLALVKCEHDPKAAKPQFKAYVIQVKPATGGSKALH